MADCMFSHPLGRVIYVVKAILKSHNAKSLKDRHSKNSPLHESIDSNGLTKNHINTSQSKAAHDGKDIPPLTNDNGVRYVLCNNGTVQLQLHTCVMPHVWCMCVSAWTQK